MENLINDNIRLFLFQFPCIKNIYCAFQGRSEPLFITGNISYKVGDNPENVNTARERLFKKLSPYGVQSWCECDQVHGNNIIVNPASTNKFSQNLPHADGMMTKQKNQALMIKTADCQPVFITDAKGEYIMALHIGWRGNRIDFPGEAINKFCETYNIKPKEIYAVRGPSLGPSSAQFINFDQEWGEEFKKWFTCGYMNLWNLTQDQIHNACGDDKIPYNQLYGIDICTSLNNSEFFSYRKNKHDGRQANFIWRI